MGTARRPGCTGYQTPARYSPQEHTQRGSGQARAHQVRDRTLGLIRGQSHAPTSGHVQPDTHFRLFVDRKNDLRANGRARLLDPLYIRLFQRDADLARSVQRFLRRAVPLAQREQQDSAVLCRKPPRAAVRIAQTDRLVSLKVMAACFIRLLRLIQRVGLRPFFALPVFVPVKQPIPPSSPSKTPVQTAGVRLAQGRRGRAQMHAPLPDAAPRAAWNKTPFWVISSFPSVWTGSSCRPACRQGSPGSCPCRMPRRKSLVRNVGRYRS